MSDYRLGDRVTVTGKLRRKDQPTSGPGHDDRAWKQETFDVRLEGIVIGIRTLSNGTNTYSDTVTYVAKEWFTAVLVTYNLRRKPILVAPDQITLRDREEVL